MQMLKRIIIGLPKSFGFYAVLEKKLQELGFEVINVSYADHDFKYKNFPQRAGNFYRKTFLRDTHHKNLLKFRRVEDEILGKLNGIEGKADCALLIRADIYPRYVIEVIKEKSKKLIGYQWDGLHRFKGIVDYIPLFDRFFVFDTSDLKKYKGVLPLTNFYFDENVSHGETFDPKTIFFVGSYNRRRMGLIKKFAETAASLGYVPDMNIFTADKALIEKHKHPYIHFFTSHMPQNVYIQKFKQAGVAVDFLNDTHNGLSFRTFEALGLSKKLITNNQSVRKYDFYHSNNISVFEKDHWEGLSNFLSKEYIPIEERVKKKYSFSNWLSYVLDMPPYEPFEIY